MCSIVLPKRIDKFGLPKKKYQLTVYGRQIKYQALIDTGRVVDVALSVQGVVLISISHFARVYLYLWFINNDNKTVCIMICTKYVLIWNVIDEHLVRPVYDVISDLDEDGRDQAVTCYTQVLIMTPWFCNDG